MSAERDLAEAIHHEIISPASVEKALDNWRHCAHQGERQRMWRALASASSAAIDAVLARRQSEAARTGPWEGPVNAQPEARYRREDARNAPGPSNAGRGGAKPPAARSGPWSET